jgi:PadR family transcriptional regulator, regulatory protein AphA
MKKTMSKGPFASGKTTLRLSPISYVVLGMVGLRGPSTSYELKRASGRTLAYFWPFPHAQLYNEPARLVDAGLLSRKREKNGRRRITYSLTKQGDAVLREWLRQAPTEIFEMRDMAVLQLFFSDFMTEDNLINLAKSQVELYRARLSEYHEIAAHNAHRAGDRRMASLDLGQRMARAVMGFWSDIAANPPASSSRPLSRPRDQG